MSPELQARADAGLCIRWGLDADACIRPYDHRGPCEDAQGNTTLTLTREILDRACETEVAK